MENQNICIATMAIPLADKNPTLLVLILSSNLYGFFRFLIFYYSEPKARQLTVKVTSVYFTARSRVGVLAKGFRMVMNVVKSKLSARKS